MDVLHCSRCGGTIQVLAVIADIAIARCILDHLGLGSTGPPVTRARGPPELTKSGTLKPLDPDLP